MAIVDTQNLPSRPVASERLKIGRGDLHKKATDFLRATILNGDLTAGRSLRESALSDQFDLSRTPVREGFRTLAAETAHHRRLRRPARRCDNHRQSQLSVRSVRRPRRRRKAFLSFRAGPKRFASIVSRAQIALLGQDLYHGTIDGIVAPPVRGGPRKSKGTGSLAITGTINPETLDALMVASQRTLRSAGPIEANEPPAREPKTRRLGQTERLPIAGVGSGAGRNLTRTAPNPTFVSLEKHDGRSAMERLSNRQQRRYYRGRRQPLLSR